MFFEKPHQYGCLIEKAKKDTNFEDLCPICYGELEIDPYITPDEIDTEIIHQTSGDSNDSNNLNSLASPLVSGKKLKKCMKTPCNHYFHNKCLEQWMNLKMECPSCRATLPPY